MSISPIHFFKPASRPSISTSNRTRTPLTSQATDSFTLTSKASQLANMVSSSSKTASAHSEEKSESKIESEGETTRLMTPDDILTAFPAGKKALMMFDYDGTLTPIVSKPEDAQIGQEGIDLLKRIASGPAGHRLGIVSGRSVEQLQGFLPDLKGLPVLLGGLHGGQIYDVQNERFLQEPTPKNAEDIAKLQETLNDLPSKYPGVHLENKRYALALHYRNAPDEQTAEQALNEFQTAATEQGLLEDFHFKPGKKVLELAPKTCNKGSAVSFMAEHFNRDADEPYFPAYFGDDKTDEDGFTTVNHAGGLSVYLGDASAETAATHNLTDHHALYQLVGKLLSRTETAS